jgi:hypothetical protein
MHLSLGWLPDTELIAVEIQDSLCTHALVSLADGSQVRVLPDGEPWPVGYVQNTLKDG